MNSTLHAKACATISVAVLLGDWRGAPFPNWSDGQVLGVLTDSAWARPKTVRLTWTRREDRPITYKDVPGNLPPGPVVQSGSPVGGIGGPKPKIPDRADLIIRWATALPVRQAKALYRSREGKLGAERVNEMIEARGDGYVLEILGIPAVVAHRGTGTLELLLRQSAYARTRTGRTIRPDRVEVTIQALTLLVKIHFPRSAEFTAADRELTCYADLQIFEFRERFQLNSMVYLKTLEL